VRGAGPAGLAWRPAAGSSASMAPGAAAGPAQADDAPAHIEGRHLALLRGLKQVARRAGRCRWGRLLQHHCPLPSGYLGRAEQQQEPGRTEGAPAGGQQQLEGLSEEQPGSVMELDLNLSPGHEGGTEGGRRPATQQAGPVAGSQLGSTQAAHPLHPRPSKRRKAGQGAATQGPAAAQGRPAPAPAAPAAGAAPAAAGPSSPPAAAGPSSPSQVDLLAACVPHARVVSFLWSALRHLLPPVLLGSRRNWRALRRSVEALVRLRRHEQLSLHQVGPRHAPLAPPAGPSSAWAARWGSRGAAVPLGVRLRVPGASASDPLTALGALLCRRHWRASRPPR
jgi:hypothetical protein